MSNRRLILPLIVVYAAAAAARAQDAVKVGGFWIENVAIQGTLEGQLIYITPGGGEVTQPWENVQAVKLGKYPALAAGVDALEAGQASEAVRQLQSVRNAAREPWVQHYVDSLLVRALDAAGRADAAVQTYLSLAQTPGVPPSMLTAPPLASVEAADDRTKVTIRGRLAEAGAKLPREGEVAEQIAALADLVRNAGPSPTATDANDPALAPTAGGPTPAGAPLAASAVTLPGFIEDDAITKLLRQGKFDQAQELAATALRSSGDLSMKLYQHGMAKLGQAEQKANLEEALPLYKDAGISFMRIIIYFPASRYRGPALVEAGYVHHKIGRDDIARGLYQKADLALGDAEESPEYYPRLRQLNEQLAGGG